MNAPPSGPAQAAKTVFVTGANGFVGSHLVRRLITEGHHVRALIRPSADRSRIADLPIEWVKGDLDDHNALRSGCEGAHWIIHVAGRIKAPNEAAYQHANCKGTINLLDAAMAVSPQLERLVYVSSQAAGGPSHPGRPRTEDVPPEPVTPYGKSKLAGEREVMARADRLPVVAVRPPAVYGPGDSETLAFFRAAKWHIKPVFGGHDPLISLVHVSDLVDGIVLACQRLEAVGQVFYIAEDRPYPMTQLGEMIAAAVDTWAVRVRIPRPVLMSIAFAAEMAGRLAGFTPRLNRHKARDFLQRDWTCSTAKAQRLLGYHSQVPFAEGARQTAAWYREQGWL